MQHLRLERVSENGIIVCSGGGGTRAHHCFSSALYGDCHLDLGSIYILVLSLVSSISFLLPLSDISHCRVGMNRRKRGVVGAALSVVTSQYCEGNSIA